jgi:hypothetical protein
MAINVAGDSGPDGVALVATTSDLINLYGGTPASQRASSIQAASVVSVSSNITIAASLTAWIQEVTATLTAIGAWKGSA